MEIETKIFEILNGMTDIQTFDVNMSFEELGLDSLDSLDFIHQVKDILDIDFHVDVKNNFSKMKIGDVISKIQERIPSS